MNAIARTLPMANTVACFLASSSTTALFCTGYMNEINVDLSWNAPMSYKTRDTLRNGRFVSNKRLDWVVELWGWCSMHMLHPSRRFLLQHCGNLRWERTNLDQRSPRHSMWSLFSPERRQQPESERHVSHSNTILWAHRSTAIYRAHPRWVFSLTQPHQQQLDGLIRW